MQQNYITLYFITLNILFFTAAHLTDPVIYFTLFKALKQILFLYINFFMVLLSFAGLPPVAMFFFKLYFLFYIFTAQITIYFIIILFYFLLSIYFYVRYMRLLLSLKTELYKNLYAPSFAFLPNFWMVCLNFFITFSFYLYI